MSDEKLLSLLPLASLKITVVKIYYEIHLLHVIYIYI